MAATPAKLAGLPLATITPSIALSHGFLLVLLDVAVTDPQAIQVWACNIEEAPSLSSRSSVYTFDEKEWDTRLPAAVPPPHRLDTYALTRGLYKCFEARHDLTIPFRQQVLRWLFEQESCAQSVRVMPKVVDKIVQLALFDQVIY